MKCWQCNEDFEAKRADAKFCSQACQKAAKRGVKSLSLEEVKVKIKAITKTAKVETAKNLKPLLNGMTGEPRLHSGWYFRTDLYRRGVIDAIKADPTLGTIEKSEKCGWLIHRDAAQKAKYDSTIPVNRIDGDWVAKFGNEWLTHEQCNEMGIDIEERERMPLYSAA